MSGLDDMFKALGSLLDLAQRLDAAGQSEFVKQGTFRVTPDAKNPQGNYGLSVKLGPRSKTGTFDNLRVDPEKLMVDQAEKQSAEIFDEPDCLLVFVELPGISEDQVEVQAGKGKINIRASGGRRVYSKEIQLPGTALIDQAEIGFRNGILVIRIPKNGK